MTAYVNQPKNTYTKQTFATNLTGYKFNPNAKNFKIYEVTNQNQFVDSFTPESQKLQMLLINSILIIVMIIKQLQSI